MGQIRTVVLISCVIAATMWGAAITIGTGSGQGVISLASAVTEASASDGMMDQDRMREMMQQMMSNVVPAGIKPKDLPDPDSKGAKLLVRYCTPCHNLPSPSMHTAEQWPDVADRMFYRMSMMSGGRGMGMMMNIEAPSVEDQKTIVAYLKAHALKSISPGAIPAPESKEAVYFKKTCSQCHALPDPKLFTADEWPGIVDRMQGYAKSMGKKEITNGEKKEIVEYLKIHSRR